MSDKYLHLVNSGAGSRIAIGLGLPRPAVLHRTAPNQGPDPMPGTLALIADEANSAAADLVAQTLLDWRVDVRRHVPRDEPVSAIVAILTESTEPGQLTEPAMAISAHLRSLAPNGRVLVLARPARGTAGPPAAAADADRFGSAPTVALAATRMAITGFLRSLAKELRYGATGNGILVDDGVDLDAPSVTAALRFFLSARSVFVDGQLLSVGAGGRLPENEDGWRRPLGEKIAVVTGAARGIGAAIATQLAADGARVICIDVPAAGEGLAQVANRIGGSALQADITAEDAGAKIAARARDRYGRLDIVVHNAGITRDKLLANMSAEKWQSVLAVNLSAQLAINAELLATNVLGAESRILAMASTSGIAGGRGQTNYGASKAGVVGMIQALAPVQADRGGTANAIAPGFIRTDMTARMPTVTREIAMRSNSLQQGGLPVDVANAIAFLATPAAGGINGQVLRVCGQNLVGQ